jgi:hypothetical protein
LLSRKLNRVLAIRYGRYFVTFFGKKQDVRAQVIDLIISPKNAVFHVQKSLG